MTLHTSDAINLGDNTISKIYLGEDIVYTSSIIKQGKATLSSSSSLDAIAVGLLANITYLMTETLVNGGGYEYFYNSGSSGATNNGRIVHTGDGSKSEDQAWTFNSNQYPENGTVDMTKQGDGFGSVKGQTNWIAPVDSEWTVSGIYDVTMDILYKMYVIHYNGDETADIYLGDQSTPLTATPTYSNVPFTPPLTQWEFGDGAHALIYATIIEYDMSSFYTA